MEEKQIEEKKNAWDSDVHLNFLPLPTAYNSCLLAVCFLTPPQPFLADRTIGLDYSDNQIHNLVDYNVFRTVSTCHRVDHVELGPSGGRVL